MQGLSGFVENVVGDINDVVDRAKADGGEALFKPIGAFGDGDVVNSGCCVERAGGGGFKFDEIAASWNTRSGRDACVPFDERSFQQSRKLARHAGVREKIGTVRGDFEF